MSTKIILTAFKEEATWDVYAHMGRLCSSRFKN